MNAPKTRDDQLRIDLALAEAREQWEAERQSEASKEYANATHRKSVARQLVESLRKQLNDIEP